jgi:hypothetical protein
LCRRHVAVQPRDRVDRIGGPPQFGHVVERVAQERALGGGLKKKAAPQEDGAARTRCDETQRVWSATHRGIARAPAL